MFRMTAVLGSRERGVQVAKADYGTALGSRARDVQVTQAGYGTR